jgi:hypothetical protein
MGKFRTSKVGGTSGKNRESSYSSEKQYSYHSQDEMIERRKELLKKQKGTKQNA